MSTSTIKTETGSSKYLASPQALEVDGYVPEHSYNESGISSRSNYSISNTQVPVRAKSRPRKIAALQTKVDRLGEVATPSARDFSRMSLFEERSDRMWKLLTRFGWLFKWTCVMFVTVLAILQITALVYAAMSKAFFQRVCEQRLSTYHRYMCSDYDKLATLDSEDVEKHIRIS